MVAAARQFPFLSLWERCPKSTIWGGEGVVVQKEAERMPSQSKIGFERPIFASSPKGRAKADCGANENPKLNLSILAFFCKKVSKNEK